MITFGFYNSLEGDRTYDSIQISSIFDGIIRDGIYMTIGTALRVTYGTGLQVIVGEGRAWFNHTWTLNDSPLPLTIAEPDVIFPRIDTVVLEVNASSNVRVNDIKIVKGDASGSPTPKALTNTSDVHQYPLAYVRVNSGATQISQGNITDKVGSVLCPFVTGPLTVIDNNTILANWTNEFNAWFNGLQGAHDDLLQDLTDDWDAWFENIQDMLDDNQAGNLQNEIDTIKAENNVLIADITSTETADEFNFDNIPNDYFNLRLTGILKMSFTGGGYPTSSPIIRVNNDSGMNYGYINPAWGLGDPGDWVGPSSGIYVPGIIGSHTGDAGVVSTFDLELPGYALTAYKWIIAKTMQANSIANPAFPVVLWPNMWKSTVPITRIQVFGTYVASLSRLRLYGTPF